MAKDEGVRALLQSLRRPSSNPVILKELRGRMRGPRAFVILTLQLAALSAFASGAIFLASLTAQSNYNSTNLPSVGKTFLRGTLALHQTFKA